MTEKKITKVVIEKELSKPLSEKAIKQREGGRGMMLDYLEGWWVKQNANRIFGIDNWSYEVVWEQMKHVILPDYKNRKEEMKKTGLYTIPVKLTVSIEGKKVVRSDIGSTQYHGEESKEIAIKGCVTDALKRCFTSFGEQFGLLLYDKGDEIQPRAKASSSAVSRGYPTQEELMSKYGMDKKQVAPKCPNCESIMKIIERKDKSGIFWSCANWRTKGCKGCNIDDVDIDGVLTALKKKNASLDVKQTKESVNTENEVAADDIPF